MSGTTRCDLELAVLTIDRNRIVPTWNPGAARLLGHPADEMGGRPVMLMVPSALVPELEAVIHTSFTGEDTEGRPVQLVRRGGQLVDIELTVAPITDARGQASGACLVAVARTAAASSPGPL